jgi:predicted nucleic acid-binding protein
MIAVDTNLLVYAHRADSPWHEPARRRLQDLAEGRARWAIPWPCVHEFLAVVTHPRIYASPTPLARALDQVDAWLESPTVVLLAESADHWTELRAASPLVA